MTKKSLLFLLVPGAGVRQLARAKRWCTLRTRFLFGSSRLLGRAVRRAGGDTADIIECFAGAGYHACYLQNP